MNIVTILLVAAGGAAGAVSRFLVARWTHAMNIGQWPVGTFTVNLLGSFAIGLLYVVITERGHLHPDWRYVLIVGYLGAFTTFSTFSLESVALLENGEISTALSYMAATLLSCVGGCWLGILAMR